MKPTNPNNMEKKQTAVEWLVEQLIDEFSNYPDAIIEQAKVMEKEQIVNAHGIKENHGFKNCRSWWEQKSGEQYYNETYQK